MQYKYRREVSQGDHSNLNNSVELAANWSQKNHIKT